MNLKIFSLSLWIVLFSYSVFAAPTINTITPTAGTTAGGTDVTINGTGFTSATQVLVGGVPSPRVVLVNSNFLYFETPIHLAEGTVSIRVQDSSGGQTRSSAYRYVNSDPTIISLSVTSGPTGGGTQTTVRGSGFKSGIKAYFHGVVAPDVDFIGANYLVVKTPPHAAGPVSLALENTDRTYVSKGSAFTYIAASPTPRPTPTPTPRPSATPRPTATPTPAPISISNLRASSSGTSVSYEFNYTGAPNFHRFYFDTDMTTTTGLPNGGVGGDFMVENGRFYRYSGDNGAWGWTFIQNVTVSNTNGVYKVTLAKADLNSPSVVNVMGEVALPNLDSNIVRHSLGSPTPTPTPRPTATPVPPTSSGPTYPRLSGFQHGGAQNYWDPAYQRDMAKLDLVILAYFNGWGVSHGVTLEQAVRGMKAINPNLKVFVYNNINEIKKTHAEPTGARHDEWLKIADMKWWAYERGTTNPINSFYSPENAAVNSTTFTPRDSTGRNWIQWHVKYVVDNWYKPNPSIDGFFVDNVFWKPRSDADWNRDGVTDLRTNPTVQTWYRLGYKQYNDTIRALMPGKLQIGNTADLPAANTPIPEYEQMLNGGAFEGMIGKGYSPETTRTGEGVSAGWPRMMKWYKRHMEILAPPKLGFFHASGTRTEYQTMRYGLASCLLGDAYYYYEDEAAGFDGVAWYDEYNVNLGRPITAAFPSSAYQNGVYRRDFEHGIVLVNPKGNGPRRVTLGGTYRKIRGTQVPSVNNGASVTYVDLSDRDGIILLRP